MRILHFARSARLPCAMMIRVALVIVFALTLFYSLSLPASEDSPFKKPDCESFPEGSVTAAHVYLHLRSCEEKQTAAVIWRTPAAKATLLHGLAAAESDWLDVSFLLLPHTNRSQSKAIVRALQEALVTKPDAVLSRASAEASVLRGVCGYPRGLTYDLASASVTERMSSVETWLSEQSQPPNSKAVRAAEECAAYLEQAEKQLQKAFGQQ